MILWNLRGRVGPLRRGNRTRRNSPVQRGPKALDQTNQFHGEKCEQCAGKPEPGKNGDEVIVGDEVPAKSHAESVRGGNDDQNEKNDVDHAGQNAKPDRSPAGGHSPKGAIPEALREKQRGQEGQ